MVEGIIQKVFKSHTDRLKIYDNMLVYTPTDTRLLIEMLKQELIEEIKKEKPLHTTHDKPFNDDYCISIHDFIKRLIGDSK